MPLWQRLAQWPSARPPSPLTSRKPPSLLLPQKAPQELEQSSNGPSTPLPDSRASSSLSVLVPEERTMPLFTSLTMEKEEISTRCFFMPGRRLRAGEGPGRLLQLSSCASRNG
jgi:hypothetical protein